MLKKIVINSITIFIASIICMSYFHFGRYNSYKDLIEFSFVLALVNIFIRPIIKMLALPITILTLGIFSLVINILSILFSSHLVHGVYLNGFMSGVVLAIIMALCHPVIELGSFIVENIFN